MIVIVVVVAVIIIIIILITSMLCPLSLFYHNRNVFSKSAVIRCIIHSYNPYLSVVELLSVLSVTIF